MEEEKTVGAEEKTAEEEADVEEEVALGLVSGALVLALLLIERSIGEQLEKEISASLQLSSLLARLFSWTEHSLSEVTEEPRLVGRTPQSSSRCPFLVSCFWLLWLLRLL